VLLTTDSERGGDGRQARGRRDEGRVVVVVVVVVVESEERWSHKVTLRCDL
jgi:hypothetical protein